MKKNVFYLMSMALIMFSFISVMKTEAQVTIGEAAPPHPASILDLRTSKGLLLSKAHLEDVTKFQLSADKTKEAAGMIIYNTNPNIKGGYGAGLYVWNGLHWDLLEESNIPAIDCSGAPSGITIDGFSRTVKPNEPFEVTCRLTTSGNTTYTWTVPQGLEISGDQNKQTITLTAKTAGSYNGGNLSCAVANACGGGSSIAGASQVLTVKDCTDKPATPGDITFSPTTVNKNASFTASISAVSGAKSYKWWFNGTELSSTTSPSKEITASAAGSIEVKVVAVNDCGTSDAKTKNITVNGCTDKPANPGDITFTKNPVNKNDKFTASISAVSGATSYKWWFNGSELSSATGTSAEITASAAGNIEVKVVAVNDCGTSDAKTKNITVNDCTAAPSGGSISLSSQTIKVSDNFTATIANLTTSGSTRYEWTIPQGLSVSGDRNKQTVSLKATNAGIYTLSCVVSNDCGNKTITDVITIAGQSQTDGYETYCFPLDNTTVCWMTQNSKLGTSAYKTYVNSNTGEKHPESGWYYTYDEANIKDQSGRYTACPAGWTLPTKDDFNTLFMYLANTNKSTQEERNHWLRSQDKEGFYLEYIGPIHYANCSGWNKWSGYWGVESVVANNQDNSAVFDEGKNTAQSATDNDKANYKLSVRCIKK